MKTYFYSLFMVLGFSFAFVLPGAAFAAMGGGSVAAPADPDIAQANRAIKDKNWDQAIALLNKALARDEKNAETHNLLGYAERNRGNLDAAFKHYERALTLDPKHRGAHEYIGEAYLMTGNLAKAEEHLADLNKLCRFSCEEYRDLKAAVDKYKQKNVK